MIHNSLSHPLTAALAACVLGTGFLGCGGGGKDDPTSVALRPSKVQTAQENGTQDSPKESKSDAAGSGATAGTLTGTIVIDEADRSNVPTKKIIEFMVGNAPIDPGVCADSTPIYDETLVVDSETYGIKNVFFYLDKKPSGGKDSIASQASWPGRGELGGDELVLDQHNCTYEPHAMLLMAGQPFIANSQDPVTHSYKFSPRSNRADNINISPKSSLKMNPFPKPEKYPIPISCATHNWMSGYQLPLDHPYAAVTNDKGAFTISEIPAGKYEFIVWHEGKKVMDYPVTVDGDQKLDIKLRLSQLN